MFSSQHSKDVRALSSDVKVSDDESAVFLTLVPLCSLWVFFPVAASKIFSFSLVFRSLNRKHVYVSLSLDLCFDIIRYCWKNPSHYLFRCFTSLSSVFSWDSNNVQVGLFSIDPQLCLVLFLLFTVHFSLCVSV